MLSWCCLALCLALGFVWVAVDARIGLLCRPLVKLEPLKDSMPCTFEQQKAYSTRCSKRLRSVGPKRSSRLLTSNAANIPLLHFHHPLCCSLHLFYSLKVRSWQNLSCFASCHNSHVLRCWFLPVSPQALADILCHQVVYPTKILKEFPVCWVGWGSWPPVGCYKGDCHRVPARQESSWHI